MEAMPTAFLNDPVFRRLGNVARLAALDKKERWEYEQSLKTYRDNYAILTTERSEGFAEGIAEGIAKGRAEGRTEGEANLVKKMLSNGLSADEVANLTGYSLADIEKLIQLQNFKG